MHLLTTSQRPDTIERLLQQKMAHRVFSKELPMDRLKKFLLQPRYLRAVPSLVVLTTVMAWADLSDVDGADALEARSQVSWVQRADDQPATGLLDGPET